MVTYTNHGRGKENKNTNNYPEKTTSLISFTSLVSSPDPSNGSSTARSTAWSTKQMKHVMKSDEAEEEGSGVRFRNKSQLSRVLGLSWIHSAIIKRADNFCRHVLTITCRLLGMQGLCNRCNSANLITWAVWKKKQLRYGTIESYKLTVGGQASESNTSGSNAKHSLAFLSRWPDLR